MRYRLFINVDIRRRHRGTPKLGVFIYKKEFLIIIFFKKLTKILKIAFNYIFQFKQFK